MKNITIGQLETINSTIISLNEIQNLAKMKCHELISQAESKVEETEIEYKKCLKKLEEALNISRIEKSNKLYDDESTNQNIAKFELRKKLARECVDLAKNQKRIVKQECNVIIKNMKKILQFEISKFTVLKSELKQRLGSQVLEKKFKRWLEYKPRLGKPILPLEVISRFREVRDYLPLYFEYLMETDQNFNNVLDRHCSDLSKSEGLLKKLIVLIKLKEDPSREIFEKVTKYPSGTFAAKVVERAFSPFGNVVITEKRTDFDDGSYTRTDVVVSDFKEDLILGKKLIVPKGGSLKIEVKTGQKSYLKSQIPHMIIQTKGHEDADISLVVVTRDFKKFSRIDQQRFREKFPNSIVFVLLPDKDILDKVCWNGMKNRISKF